MQWLFSFSSVCDAMRIFPINCLIGHSVSSTTSFSSNCAQLQQYWIHNQRSCNSQQCCTRDRNEIRFGQMLYEKAKILDSIDRTECNKWILCLHWVYHSMHRRNCFVASLGRFGFRKSHSIRGWRRRQYRQPVEDRMDGCVRTMKHRFRHNHRYHHNNLFCELQKFEWKKKKKQCQHRHASIIRK